MRLQAQFMNAERSIHCGRQRRLAAYIGNPPDRFRYSNTLSITFAQPGGE